MDQPTPEQAEARRRIAVAKARYEYARDSAVLAVVVLVATAVLLAWALSR